MEESFKKNVDAWIKKINSELSESRQFTSILKETAMNTDHNYELIKELRRHVIQLEEKMDFIEKSLILLMELKSITL